MLTQPEWQVVVRKLIMEEKKNRTDSLKEWARNNYGRHISLRVARKYLRDDAYFWAELSDARSTNHLEYWKYTG